MTPSTTETTTYGAVVRMHTACRELAARRLPSAAAERKLVTLLRRHLGPAHTEYEDRRALVIARHPIPATWSDPATMPVAVTEARMHELKALSAEAVTIPAIPDALRLTAEDMPRASKSEDGNTDGLAALQDLLGVLYPLED